MHSYAQNEASKWYFGYNAGLDFMTSPPTVLVNGALVTNEGCAAIANSSGNLLFYTDGRFIYDQTHSQMANGSGLNGGLSSTQSAIIVKQPGNTNLYYVFTAGQVAGALCYSIVDMNLATGNGSVTVKNVTLNPAPTMSEKLISVPHCNGIDSWIVAHNVTNQFVCYLLTSAGLSSAVTSTVGTSHTTPITGSINTLGFTGNMKVSPNGKKIGLAVSGVLGFFELFDFDNSTGLVSNPLYLGFFPAAYGCEFSPDGSKFYGDVEPFPYSLRQWDLCAGSPSAIVASLYTQSVPSKIMGMQRAIDGKIYIAQSAVSDLGVINSPNSASAACAYMHTGQSVFPKVSDLNLPNFTLLYKDQQPAIPPYTYTISSTYGCNTASFNSVYNGSTTILGCTAVSASLLAVSWDFGDPLTGSANTSNLMNPMHAFSASGTFTVQQVFHYSCGRKNDTISQVLNVNQPCLQVNSTSITCASPGSATCQAWGGIGPYSYTWVPTQQTGTLATGLGPGSYTIYFHDVGANATYSSLETFVPPVAFTGNILTNTSVVCYGASTATSVVSNISGGSGTEYFSWTNGSVTYTSLNTPTIGILSAGVWTIQVTDALTNCTFSQVDVIMQPTVSLLLSSNSPTACVNNNLVLTGVQSGGAPFLIGQPYNYTWTAGPTSASYTINESISGTHIYTLTSKDSLNCLLSNTIAVNFIPKPNISVTSVSICPQQIGTLLANGATSYIWSGPSVGPVVGSSLSDSPLTDTEYTVVGSAQSCTTSATGSIFLKPLPFVSMGISSPVCEHDLVSMSVYGGSSYVWSGPTGFYSSIQAPQLPNVSTAQSGVYHVTVTAANTCTVSVNGTLVINATPGVTITTPTVVCTSQTLNLSASSVPGSSYVWTGPQSFSSTSQNTIATNLQTGATSYSLMVTSPQTCTNTALVNVNVIPPPSLNTVLSSPSVCAQAINGSPNTLTLTSFGANTYTLNTPLNFFNVPISQSVSAISSDNAGAGIATATLTGSNGVCTSTAAVNFSVIPNPNVGVSSSTPVICAGQSFTYTSSGAQSYLWQPNSPYITTYSLGQIAVCNPLINSVFSVMG
ncbi:MAG: hypothetical protein JNL60_08235, partial [Bacteroidia bacterium]|nr:hypothetical protein [Bacteroidia bacterium]